MEQKVNHYALFAFQEHEELGGWSDLKGVFLTPEDAELLFVSENKKEENKFGHPFVWNVAQIVHLEKMELVREIRL